MEARAPDRLEALRSLRSANADAAFATAFGTLVGGTFLVGFIRLLGGSDLWIGALTAIPSLVGLLQLPGAIAGRRVRSRRAWVLPGGLVWRLLYIPVAVLPLVGLAAGAKLALLLGCVTLAALVINLVNPTYNEWLAELIPGNARGAFFSVRNAIATAVGTAAGMGGALLLDRVRRAGAPAEGFAAVFALGVAFGLVSFGFFLRTRDVPRERVEREGLAAGLRAFATPFRERSFRPTLAFLAATIFGQGFAGQLFTAYALESLRLSFSQIQLLTVFHAIGNVASSRVWGSLADRYGNKPMLAIAGGGLVLTPLPWIVSPAGNPSGALAILLPAHVLMGVIWSGVAVCQFNLLLSTAPEEERGSAIGAGLATQALLGGLAPLAGASLMASLRSGLDPATAYRWTFGGTIALRFVAVLTLLPVIERGAEGLRTTLRHLGAVTPAGIRALRSFARSGDEAEREAAIETMTERPYALAGDELRRALHDPSPRVRRQAASALGRLGDAKATADLVHQLERHPDLVEEETILALGEIGDAAAVPALVGRLDDPRSMLRRAAARALGSIPGAMDEPSVRSALLQLASDRHDPDARRGALQALRRGAVGADVEETVCAALLDAHPSVRIAACEAATELGLEACAEALRESLGRYDDEATAEAAYALGVLGAGSDLEAVLRVAERFESMTTRRRALLGAARLLGVERSAYRLLLTEGMARDRELISMVGGKAASREARALAAYGAGDEAGALRRLPLPAEAEGLRACRAPETFLVALCVFARDA